jgi:hypothetical protein
MEEINAYCILWAKHWKKRCEDNIKMYLGEKVGCED